MKLKPKNFWLERDSNPVKRSLILYSGLISKLLKRVKVVYIASQWSLMLSYISPQFKYYYYDPKLLLENYIMENLDTKINIWSCRGLSLYGKVTIIKSLIVPKFVAIFVL